MKQGQESFGKLWEKLEAERAGMRDYVANTQMLQFSTDKEGASTLLMEEPNNTVSQMGVSDLAHRQMAARLQIPFKYYEKMRVEQPALLDTNVNTWLHERPENRMVRTLFGNVRAILSDRYQRLDNLELAHRVLKVLKENPLWAVGSCEVTETFLYIKVVSDKLKAEVEPGDVVQAGFVVSNSEVGLGCVKIEPLIYRLVCSNGMIRQELAHRKYHVGKRIDDFEFGAELYRDETIEQDNKTYFMKVEDILRGAVNEKLFENTVQSMRLAKLKQIPQDPVATVKLLGDSYRFTESETMLIGANYMRENDYTQYGLMNAVTRASQEIKDYNRATEFERIGGQLLDDIGFLLKDVDSRKVG